MFECLRRGGTVVSNWAACTSPRSFDLSGEVDGDYTFEVARDAVGNTSGATADVYTLDRSGPSAPSIDSAPATPSADPAPSWAFSGEASASFECRLSRSGTIVSNWSACSGSRGYDLTGEADGSYLFSVRARDEAGNTGPAATSSYSLDRSAPAVPTIDSAPASRGRTATRPGASRPRRRPRSSAAWSAAGAPCPTGRPARARSRTTSTSAPDGAYTFKVRARNPLGTLSAPQSDAYTLDTTAPAAPSINTNPGAVGSSRSLRGASPARAAPRSSAAWRARQRRLRLGGLRLSMTYDLSGQADGPYEFKVRARDAAGNTGSAANHTYELDTSGPAAPALTAAPASPGSSRAPAWSWSGDGGATFVCKIDRGSDAVTAWAPCVSGQPQDLSGQPDGTYTLSVRAVDAAGNSGGVMTSAYELDTTAGTVSIANGPRRSCDPHPAWSFAAESGAAVSCRLVFGSDVVADWAACGSPHSFDLTGRPDGDYRSSSAPPTAPATPAPTPAGRSGWTPSRRPSPWSRPGRRSATTTAPPSGRSAVRPARPSSAASSTGPARSTTGGRARPR